MFATRIIPKTCNIISRNVALGVGSVTSGPPTIHVPPAEKLGLGIFMVASLLVVPAWVLVHIDSYKKRD